MASQDAKARGCSHDWEAKANGRSDLGCGEASGTDRVDERGSGEAKASHTGETGW